MRVAASVRGLTATLLQACATVKRPPANYMRSPNDHNSQQRCSWDRNSVMAPLGRSGPSNSYPRNPLLRAYGTFLLSLIALHAYRYLFKPLRVRLHDQCPGWHYSHQLVLPSPLLEWWIPGPSEVSSQTWRHFWWDSLATVMYLTLSPNGIHRPLAGHPTSNLMVNTILTLMPAIFKMAPFDTK